MSAADITEVTEATDEVVSAVEKLAPQLTVSGKKPESFRAQVERIIGDENSALLVARADGNISGMVVGTVRAKTLQNEGWIDDLVVDKNARRGGIGSALMDVVIRWCWERGADTVGLSARPERGAANNLYQKLGFDRKETNVYILKKPKAAE